MTTNAILNDEMINNAHYTMGNLENTIDEINDELNAAKPTVKEKAKTFLNENGYDLLNIAVEIYWIIQQVFITKRWRYEKHHPMLTFLVTGGRNKEQASIFCAFGAGVKMMSITASIGKIIARCIK
jgi:hypothetical protein